MGVISIILGLIGIAAISATIIINTVKASTIIISLSGLVIVIIGLILSIKGLKEKKKNGQKAKVEIVGIIICAVATIILLAISGILIVENYYIQNSLMQLAK